MKRIAVTLVGLVAAVLIPIAPAHADKPTCYAVPDLPGECLSTATYFYIAQTTLDAADLWHENLALRDEIYTLRTRVDSLEADLSEARRLAAHRLARIIILRAKVTELRLLVHGRT